MGATPALVKPSVASSDVETPGYCSRVLRPSYAGAVRTRPPYDRWSNGIIYHASFIMGTLKWIMATGPSFGV